MLGRPRFGVPPPVERRVPWPHVHAQDLPLTDLGHVRRSRHLKRYWQHAPHVPCATWHTDPRASLPRRRRTTVGLVSIADAHRRRRQLQWLGHRPFRLAPLPNVQLLLPLHGQRVLHRLQHRPHPIRHHRLPSLRPPHFFPSPSHPRDRRQPLRRLSHGPSASPLPQCAVWGTVRLGKWPARHCTVQWQKRSRYYGMLHPLRR